MEVLNSSVCSNPQLKPTFPIFTSKFSFTSQGRLLIPNSAKYSSLHSPSLLRSSLSNQSRFRISARFHRPTNRRNFLRKKLFEQHHQVRHNRIIYDPTPESQKPLLELDTDYVAEPEIGNLNGKTSSVDPFLDAFKAVSDSGIVKDPESKAKSMGESVLWNKLESWVEQYKRDIDFWGIGTSPIFTVFQDSEGKVSKVVVDENEIARRRRVDPLLVADSELEGFDEVKSKISYAKTLAREMENGNHELLKNSSVAKFEVSVAKSGFASTIQGVAKSFTLDPHLSSMLPRAGMAVLCGFFVIWALKQMFVPQEDREELSRLEKEMLRRKIKARMEKEKTVKGSVEVIAESTEPNMVSAEKPQLDKQELMSNILKARITSDKLVLSEYSDTLGSREEFDYRIQEIREMARHARESEKRDSLPDSNDGEDNRKEVERHIHEIFGSSTDIIGDDSTHLTDLSATVRHTAADGSQDYARSLSDEASLSNSDVQSTTPNIEDPHANLGSLAEVSNLGYHVNSPDEIDKNVQFNTPHCKSSNSRENLARAKSGVIRSTKEAREYLSKKRDKHVVGQEMIPEYVEELDMSPTTENLFVTDGGQKLDKTGIELEPSTSTQAPDFIQSSVNCGSDGKTSAQVSAINGEVVERKGNEDIDLRGSFVVSSTEDCHTSGETRPCDLILPEECEIERKASKNENSNGKTSQSSVLMEASDPTFSSLSSSQHVLLKKASTPDKINSLEDVEVGEVDANLQRPEDSIDHEENSRSTQVTSSKQKESWMEKNFHEFDPILKKMQDGFRKNYKVAKDKSSQNLKSETQMMQLNTDKDDNKLEWMKDERLKDIVFRVRENELAGRDPFHSMDDEDKLAFFSGLEEIVERENEKLSNLHEWLHSSIENLDYGADGISLYDPPEKIIPHWRGSMVGNFPEFIDNFVEEHETEISENIKNGGHDGEQKLNFLQKSRDSSCTSSPSILSNENGEVNNEPKKASKTTIESSDGSVRTAKKSGKEYWEHTKKWSEGFLESYNAEADPEMKTVMKDIGKDLDRWITEKEIKEAANLMDRLPDKGQKLIRQKLDRVKREMELFGPQAVVSKYREYADEKEEDYLWWLDLPFILCIELYTKEESNLKVGFYSLEMAADLELDPKQYHIIAFEDAGDCKSLCYIIQAHMEMLGNGSAFVVARPPKDAFREAKANGFSVTVIRKGELQLNVDQTLEEVEELITEIGSKIYHDKIMQERSLDISSVMKGVFGSRKARTRKRSKRKLKKPTKP